MKNTVDAMTYVEFMAFLDETNRPPGGKRALKKLLDYARVSRDDFVLDVGCNTGFCTFETVRLTGAQVTGIDISPDMIRKAQASAEKDVEIGRKTKFLIVDAKKMPFTDNEFDFVFSGGSTAFVDDIPAALKEYARVTKKWGFIGDINFYYKTQPREGLIDDLNNMMGTAIEAWDRTRWEALYQEAGLEIFDVIEQEIHQVDRVQIKEYVEKLLRTQDTSVKEASEKRLAEIFDLFNENHKYLRYAIFILRKRTTPEEPYLFEA
jgi:ubiquinone/menaquinone biosynthesis C-methylase UbiE